MSPVRVRKPREPRWQRRPDARPDEILRAALQVFGESGYQRATLTEIARRAGLSKAALYRYFVSKDTLFRELIRSLASTALGPESLAAEFFPEAGEHRLRRFMRETWTALRRPELVTLAKLVYAERGRFPELGRFYVDEVLLRIRRRLDRVLAAARAQGEFRLVAHDFALHAVPSWLLHQAMLRDGLEALDPQAPSDEQVIEGSTDLLLHGVRSRSGA